MYSRKFSTPRVEILSWTTEASIYSRISMWNRSHDSQTSSPSYAKSADVTD